MHAHHSDHSVAAAIFANGTYFVDTPCKHQPKGWNCVTSCSAVDNKVSQLSSLVVCGPETSLAKPLVGAWPVKP
jgi:hypothetical protein